jgi:hypothetical protein
MSNLLKRSTTFAVAILTGTSFSFEVQADKQKFSVKQNYTVLSISKVTPDDVPEHEVALETLSASITSETNPDWNGITMLDHVYSDSVAGSGTHSSYATEFHKDGSKTFWRYEGTHKTTVKDGGAWETQFTGTGHGRGGTGNFRNFKGNVSYECRATAEATTCDMKGEIDY